MESKAQRWMTAALEWGRVANDWTIVTKTTPAFVEWQKYFQEQGFVPWSFRRLEKGEAQEWTAPCQWPVWFPADWDKPKQVKKPEFPRLVGR